MPLAGIVSPPEQFLQYSPFNLKIKGILGSSLAGLPRGSICWPPAAMNEADPDFLRPSLLQGSRGQSLSSRKAVGRCWTFAVGTLLPKKKLKFPKSQMVRNSQIMMDEISRYL